MNELSAETLATLRAVDTPTICNALELIMGRRTSEGFTRRPVVAAWPEMPSIVGFARTATIRSAAPSREDPAIVRTRRLNYYDYVASGPAPSIVVIEDQDETPGLGAFWGEVNVAIHKGLGLSGVVTNGAIRDLGAIDSGFQLLAGNISPSHAFVHVTGFGEPVSVFGLAVRHGDLLHADRHGAATIPSEMIEELPRAIALMVRKEAPILKAARSPGFDVAKLRIAWGEAEDVH